MTRKVYKMKRKLIVLVCVLLICSLALVGCDTLDEFLNNLPITDGTGGTKQENPPHATLDSIPEYDGKNAYVIINDNTPYFDSDDTSTTSYEQFSELDSLGRCGVATACIGTDLMPTEERGSIGQVKPSGWHTVKYDIVDGKYLYNRCHLIGFQLTGENANNKNLITGTRYLNVVGMLPFENKVADYLKEQTENHVLYRVTPIYDGTNLVATGVLMEAKSVEDNGEGILFCIFVYNVQPGVAINYKDGTSRLATDPPADDSTNKDTETCTVHYDTTGDGLCEECGESAETRELETFVLNTNTQKFHKTTCTHAGKIAAHNRATYTGVREDLILEGYDPCGTCKP